MVPFRLVVLLAALAARGGQGGDDTGLRRQSGGIVMDALHRCGCVKMISRIRLISLDLSFSSLIVHRWTSVMGVTSDPSLHVGFGDYGCSVTNSRWTLVVGGTMYHPTKGGVRGGQDRKISFSLLNILLLLF
ncbi:hypothetical protein Dimus_004097 [Dionaea muscipula]